MVLARRNILSGERRVYRGAGRVMEREGKESTICSNFNGDPTNYGLGVKSSQVPTPISFYFLNVFHLFTFIETGRGTDIMTLMWGSEDNF